MGGRAGSWAAQLGTESAGCCGRAWSRFWLETAGGSVSPQSWRPAARIKAPAEEQDKLAQAAVDHPVSSQSWRPAAWIKAPAWLETESFQLGECKLHGMDRKQESGCVGSALTLLVG